MNLQQIKEDHAKELGYTDFEELFSECAHTGVDIFIDMIARKYSCEKIKEVVKHYRTQVMDDKPKAFKSVDEIALKVINQINKEK